MLRCSHEQDQIHTSLRHGVVFPEEVVEHLAPNMPNMPNMQQSTTQLANKSTSQDSNSCVGNAWTFVPPQPVAEDLPPDDSSLPEGACSTLATESLVTSSTPNRAKLHVLRATPTWFPKLVKMSLLFLSMSGGKKCVNSLPKKHPCQDALGSKKSHQIKGSTWYHQKVMQGLNSTRKHTSQRVKGKTCHSLHQSFPILFEVFLAQAWALTGWFRCFP